MIRSPYETSVTKAHCDDNKRVEPSLRNLRAKAGCAKHHQGKPNEDR